MTMKKQLSIVLILAVLLMGISGCIFTGNNSIKDSDDVPAVPSEDVSQLVVLKNIPYGFEYLGNKSLTSDVVNKEYAKAENVVEAAEGIYKGTNLDYYITVIKFEDTISAETFLANYKATFKVLQNNDTFQQVEFAGHEATRGMSYSTIGGKKFPRYKYFWNAENYVFIVIGNSADPAVGLEFAKAIGY
ncbi:MAG: hypothetical protein H5T43_04160 [Methanomethylovorans sp.]|jgi:PBP1b-binding outer membrane lipoprotein LpoB|nr:hypothetical protein [Methanomethylovorans sp.]